jgi:hypothetical protein
MYPKNETATGTEYSLSSESGVSHFQTNPFQKSHVKTIENQRE